MGEEAAGRGGISLAPPTRDKSVWNKAGSLKKGGGVADYIVYIGGDERKVHLYSQYLEEHYLLLNLVPGKDLVVLSEVVGVNLDDEARRQAEMYFRGEHPDSKRIDCWAAGTLQRQACLKSE